jgi:hypothetical protein
MISGHRMEWSSWVGNQYCNSLILTFCLVKYSG